MFSMRIIAGKSIKSLPVVICLFGSVFMAGNVSGGSSVINSLPYTINTDGAGAANPDTYYVDGTNLSSTTNGITINADFIYLDLQGDTITFGTGGGSINRGVYIRGYPGNFANHVTVTNGWIIHDGDGESNKCMDIKWVKNTLVDGVNMKVMSGTGAGDDLGGHCIVGTGYAVDPMRVAYNVEIKNCSLWNNVTQFERRDYFQACAIKLDNGYRMTDSSDFEYTWKIHDNVIVNTPHVGIFAWSRTGASDPRKVLAYIYDNHITVDARNDLYPSYPAGQYHGTTNPYGIFLKWIGGGSEIYGNTIRSGTSYGGGRGMTMEACHGSNGSHVLVHDNDINIHEGPNTEYGSSIGTFGFRMRYNNKYVDVYNNVVACSTDADTGTRDRGHFAKVLYFTSGVSGFAHDNHIYNNTIKLIADGDASASAGAFELKHDSEAEQVTNVFENNRFESNSDMWYLGEYNLDCAYLRAYKNTLVRTTPTQSGAKTYRVGYYTGVSTGNYIRDMVYQGGVAEDDFVWNGSNGVDADLSFQRTLAVYVIGNNSLPVPGATVRAVNAYNDTVLLATTDGAGRVSGPVTYLYESRYDGDSTAFNDFVLTAQKDGESNSINFTVSNTSADAIIPLNIAGDSTGYTLITYTDGCGSVVVDPDDQAFLYGTEVELTAIPCDSEWIFTHWSYGSTANPDTITIISDTTVTAYFQDLLSGLYTLTVSVAGCGSVTIDPDSSEYHYGTEIMLTAEPCSAWTFSNWSGDLPGNDNPVTIMITGDLAVVANFGSSVDIQGPSLNDMEFPENGRRNVFSNQPVFSVSYIPNTPFIYFQVDDNAGFDSPVESGPIPTAAGASTTWKIPEAIMQDTIYYWRVSSDNVVWTNSISFSALLEIHAYPNPFKVSAGHSAITFTNLPSNSRLTVASVSGSIVFQETELGPGDWIWDIRSNAWSDLASGVYLYSVEFDGEMRRGKIMIIW